MRPRCLEGVVRDGHEGLSIAHSIERKTAFVTTTEALAR